ncbi:MAG: beta-lactamase family protein [Bacteroidetes bacterium]|nr:beta-lactamase family protein [Bacteroidota bacterium]
MRYLSGVFILLALFSCTGNTKKRTVKKIKQSAIQETIKSIPFSEQSRDRLNGYWKHLHRATGYTGVSMFAFNDSIYFWSAGLADSATELNPEMPMQIASISKTFCATACMILNSKGKLKLTDTLRQFYPELPYYNITVEQMLSHCSGLPEYTWFTDVYWHDSLGPLNNYDLIALMALEKPEAYFTPGKRHQYCNTNFVLLASIIEKISGISYPEFLQKNIFHPLGMRQTKVLPPDFPVRDYEVKGHYGDGRVFPFHYQDGTYGDKNIVSTVLDLYRFYLALRDNKLFPDSIKNEMFRVRFPNARRGTGYALGWRVRKTEKETWMFHSGWWHGFRTNMYFSLEENKFAVTLCNRLSGGFIPGQTIVALFDENEWNAMHKSRKGKAKLYSESEE